MKIRYMFWASIMGSLDHVSSYMDLHRTKIGSWATSRVC